MTEAISQLYRKFKIRFLNKEECCRKCAFFDAEGPLGAHGTCEKYKLHVLGGQVCKKFKLESD